eukprot:CAMPEP_0206620242 /NCGR_PEP_ID=MMETSP0325_2-20121206/61473_1 /ASSEMBLY_ACC=CAM_ASM_000347 /TAXON_ID=2866 /ORGANISM="Crypthecodinium cohnii, Strain Seligo" /LENGTH=48 /DNA_ID= /DNA_START= /DNA_END= /DNA_ORIENTATION=
MSRSSGPAATSEYHGNLVKKALKEQPVSSRPCFEAGFVDDAAASSSLL